MFFNREKKVTYAVYSDVGERTVNEDSVKVSEQDHKKCFVLCDGLGGHGMGDVASQCVTEVFAACLSKDSNMSEFLAETFEKAQKALLERQKEYNAESKMKTTCVAVVVDRQNVYVGHVGDSRGYVFQGNKVKCRTIDHSIPQMLALSGEIKESEIRHHPDRNLVLRVMGTEWEESKYELMSPLPLKSGMAFLLCSDGFWEFIEEDKMCELLKKAQNVQEWLDFMTEIVKKKGMGTGMDNNSAIAVWVR